MPKYIIRKKKSITKDEIDQVSDLILEHYGATTKLDFIDWRLSEKANFDIVLLKDRGKVQAVSFYHTKRQPSPFSKRKILVVQFGIALKHKGYSGNVIWKMGKWYARKTAGPFYPFRTISGVSAICNPRVYESFIKLFPRHYPTKIGEVEASIKTFLDRYIDQRGLPFPVDQDLCFQDPSLSEFDVTDQWVKYCGARDALINLLFIDKGIIRYHNGRYIKTGKHLLAFGYRAPLKFDLSVWMKPKRRSALELKKATELRK